MILSKVVAAVGGLVVVASCAAVPQQAPGPRTAVPHVVAADHLELGRGIGRAQAADRLCELVEIFAVARGESGDHASDVQFRDLRERGVVEAILARPAPIGPTEQVRDLMSGFVAGYNDHVRTDPSCGASPITELDLYRFAYVVGNEGIFRGLAGIVNAEPPGVDGPRATAPAPRPNGSNAIAVGSAGSRSGRGVLLGNPHVPWRGIASFWHARLTIPGVMDVEGAQVLGLPVAYNGYTRDVAWSATISSAVGYALVELTLVPGDPTSYLVDGKPRRMERTAEGLWLTEFGPVLEELRTNAWLTGDEVTPLPWTTERAYAIVDAAADRLTSLNAVARFPEARGVADLRAFLEQGGGTARTNFVAADRAGRALFAGVQVVPDVDVEGCPTGLGRQLYPRTGVPVVDGSRSECAPRGVLPVDRMPVLETTDHATNSNASHTFSHADGRLRGFPRIFGDEEQPNLRTRFGLAEIARHLGRFDAPLMQELALANRNTAAELHLDRVLAECAAWPELARPCEVLAGWDRRNDTGSRGALLFDAFWAAGGTREALATAARELGDAMDDPLGDHQYLERDGERIPMHGGPATSGVYNLLHVRDGKVSDGTSFLMAVEFTDAECPTAYTLMAPRDPQDYARKIWRPGVLCD